MININISKPIIEREEIEAVNAVLNSGMLAQGPKVKELEEKFAEYSGTRYAVAVNSGTAALHAAMYAVGVGEGDEAITTPFTFVATANSILMQKAKVVFADISEEDFNIDINSIKEKISAKTKVIAPVDLFGQIYNIEGLNRLAAERGIKIIEDACQAVGAEYKGKRAGSFGTAGTFSFYATKNLMSGEGGMIVTDDAEVYEQAKRFRHHGQSESTKYEYFDLGYNYRMTDLAAAIALVQLSKIERFNARRAENAEILGSGLADVEGLIVPKVKDDYKHVFHQFSVRITPEFKLSREELMDALKNKGIGTAVFYPKPLHLHPHFKKFGYQEGDFPVAEKISREILSLPVHPLLGREEMEYIIKSIREI
ncbi:MAG: DegT/DnrJ/EryC1/StrS family aminotransferase [Patescibacteria group bacterium]|nr:DegT/DnrJ/EryC1/StrS family aminotransferase [Patescibacteria group bacterium]MDD5491024.1 DegT/DnrJ/EryC1/StrS family aminotransferase [Patescibacteria group bacterium]